MVRRAASAHLREAIGWSYRLLSGAERTLFQRLGVFVGGVSLDAARAILPSRASESELLAILAALVDQNALFKQIAAAGGVPINPPKCCSLAYRGGLSSLDGLHPSNTGYALIANVFIQQLNTSYNLGIPQVNVGAVYATDPYAPGNGVSGFSVIRSPQ